MPTNFVILKEAYEEVAKTANDKTKIIPQVAATARKKGYMGYQKHIFDYVSKRNANEPISDLFIKNVNNVSTKK